MTIGLRVRKFEYGERFPQTGNTQLKEFAKVVVLSFYK